MNDKIETDKTNDLHLRSHTNQPQILRVELDVA